MSPAKGEVLDYLVDRLGMSRRDGESDELLRKRAQMRHRPHAPGSIASIMDICDAYGDPDTRIIRVLEEHTTIVFIDLPNGIDEPELREELKQRHPAGGQIIVTSGLAAWLDEARLEGAQQERVLSWWDRVRRWWGGR